jgi:hypothetical protein
MVEHCSKRLLRGCFFAVLLLAAAGCSDNRTVRLFCRYL